MPKTAIQSFIKEKSLPEFVEVALPLPLRQTFTYRLPAGLQENAQTGARLLVPFGKRFLTGYAVALHQKLPAEVEIEAEAIKEAVELLDEEPLITEEILRLTQWTADYYACSWGEILKASLPAGINASVEQIVSVSARGRDELLKISTANTTKVKILRYLSENGETPQRELAKVFGESNAARVVRELVQSNWATVFQRTLTAQAKPKRRKAVRLLPPEFHNVTPSSQRLSGQHPARDSRQDAGVTQKFTEAQERIIETLLENNGEMLFTELTERAETGASAINTLAKRGFLEVFVQEVR